MPNTAGRVWEDLLAGNARFSSGAPEHPNQSGEYRNQLSNAQFPRTALLGCSDSRLSAEIIFDQGLGDMFAVRNAGQVVNDSAVGSLEYAVEVLGTNLIVVLGHDKCGAIRAAIDSIGPDAQPLPPRIWIQVAPIVTSVREIKAVMPDSDFPPAPAVMHRHIESSVNELLNRSELIAAAVASGRVAIVGASYEIATGIVTPEFSVGDL